jgi:hypothetical protein
MQVLVQCPQCAAGLPVASGEAQPAIRCGRCGTEIPLAITDGVRLDRAVDRCPVCHGTDFYLRKDFDPKIGLGVVITGAVTSAVFYWFGRDLAAYGALAAAVLIDLIVYGRLRDVTVCYRCHAEFRGAYERRASAFDLHTADVLEVEYQRQRGRR